MKDMAHRVSGTAVPGESLATLFLGAAALVLLFVVLFVLIPVALS